MIIPGGLPESVFALAFALLLIAPLALIAGVALINTGLGRSRSAAQALLGNLAIIAVAAIVFAFVGASFAGTPGKNAQAMFFHAAGQTLERGWEPAPFCYAGASVLHRYPRPSVQ